MNNGQFYYDATGFNTLNALADLVIKALNGEIVAGSDQWQDALLAMPVDSLAQFQSVDRAQLKLEEILRDRVTGSSQIEQLRALGDQAVEDLRDIGQPGAN